MLRLVGHVLVQQETAFIRTYQERQTMQETIIHLSKEQMSLQKLKLLCCFDCFKQTQKLQTMITGREEEQEGTKIPHIQILLWSEKIN